MKHQLISINARVESATKPGFFYNVSLFNNNWSCSCPASDFQKKDCKHIVFMRQLTGPKKLSKEDLLSGKY